MKTKCPQCKAKIDKKTQYCDYCGFEMFKKEQPTENVCVTEQHNIPTNKTCFITCGDVFFIGGRTQLLGIVVQKISVGDVIKFNNEKLIVEAIDTYRTRGLTSVESGNCALTFTVKNQKKFKNDLLALCDKFGDTNRPINFTTKPTTKYIFLDLE